MASPLGRYAMAGALVACVFVLVAAVLYRFLYRGGDTFLDQLAILAFGVLIGQVNVRSEAVMQAAARINGLEGQVAAAHRRLDATGAPPGGQG